MFTYEGPVAAAKDLRAFMRAKGNSLPAKLAEKLDTAVDEGSSATTLVDGMEWLYSALVEVDAEDGVTPITKVPATALDLALQTLGVMATAVAHGQYHGKGERAWIIAAWAANEINPTPADTLVLDVDKGYSFAPPRPVEPMIVPAAPTEPET